MNFEDDTTQDFWLPSQEVELLGSVDVKEREPYSEYVFNKIKNNIFGKQIYVEDDQEFI